MTKQFIATDDGWELIDDDSPTIPNHRPSYEALVLSLRDSEKSLKASSERAVKVAEQCKKGGTR
jgi:hypothetical protein